MCPCERVTFKLRGHIGRQLGHHQEAVSELAIGQGMRGHSRERGQLELNTEA